MTREELMAWLVAWGFEREFLEGLADQTLESLRDYAELRDLQYGP